MLERIGNLSAPLAPKVVDDMKQMNSHDLEDVMIIIVRRIQKREYRVLFLCVIV